MSSYLRKRNIFQFEITGAMYNGLWDVPYCWESANVTKVSCLPIQKKNRNFFQFYVLNWTQSAIVSKPAELKVWNPLQLLKKSKSSGEDKGKATAVGNNLFQLESIFATVDIKKPVWRLKMHKTRNWHLFPGKQSIFSEMVFPEDDKLLLLMLCLKTSCAFIL